MSEIERTRAAYDAMYGDEEYYWSRRPSETAYLLLRHLPPDRSLRLLDLGCGEGRNAVFFARKGYRVLAVDISPAGIAKTERLAAEAGTRLETAVADMHEFCLEEPVDVVFPARASGPVVAEGEGVRVVLRPRGARPVPAKVVDGKLAYLGVYPETDSLHIHHLRALVHLDCPNLPFVACDGPARDGVSRR